MKREGRQHGMVRTYRVLPSALNPRPDTRLVNDLDSPPTAGLFTRVSSKPTNHSKFTGKCGKPRCTGCHMHPASKAKDKSKGTHRLKSSDVVSNHRWVTWRVVERRQGLSFSSYSASALLDQLDDDYDYDYDYDHDYDDGCGGDVGQYDGSCGRDCDCDDVAGFQPIRAEIVMDNGGDDENGNHVDEDDAISYCNVGFVIDQVDGDGDWCLVEEL